MSNNNGTGFWVIVALIAAMSLVAIIEAAIATTRALAHGATGIVLRALAKRPANGGRRLAA